MGPRGRLQACARVCCSLRACQSGADRAQAHSAPAAPDGPAAAPQMHVHVALLHTSLMQLLKTFAANPKLWRSWYGISCERDSSIYCMSDKCTSKNCRLAGPTAAIQVGGWLGGWWLARVGVGCRQVWWGGDGSGLVTVHATAAAAAAAAAANRPALCCHLPHHR